MIARPQCTVKVLRTEADALDITGIFWFAVMHGLDHCFLLSDSTALAKRNGYKMGDGL